MTARRPQNENGTHHGRGKGRGIPSAMRARQVGLPVNWFSRDACSDVSAERGDPVNHFPLATTRTLVARPIVIFPCLAGPISISRRLPDLD